MTFSVAVAGASGYAGGELLRLIAQHPEFELRTVTAHANAGQPLVAVHPHLRSLREFVLVDTTTENLAGHDVVFLALPHGKSGALAATLPESVLIVDCGADHRLTDERDWAEYYGGAFAGAWPYGLPELSLGLGKQRQRLEGVRRIAVPGCNVTAITLSLAPGLHAGVIESTDLVSVLAVGPSGAGKSLRTDLLASELLGSAHAYGLGGEHRHNPEIRQNLFAAGGAPVSLSFTPVLVPMARGILATSTAKLAPGISAQDVRAAWESAYADENFVHLLPQDSFPRVADVIGANTALIGLRVDERAHRVVVVTALDNLVKGTAGAAIQSTNLALGLPETLGLSVNGVAP
ncbi:N-acetyl-gamma-glutamyl-phosphate reductase [Rathayibacter toxicus]|uniref:N-acetyl-gamma-glutamyl-phosphate reductase n=1 Tax=Rathayibacter toxicus TaxID=145458 RepID=A0A0C5BDU7_9MICO|nr:N-acetyl-gamma-glutamyl-phosphate reductase [Rathayibacter toxicus]AJM77421.1 N-acetyl-gamma-glutamyl-phosphate reductase [Rathayibacter toxicus]ALS56680.1 N-acetyl-gamma-glutamyl-phosphate reductase [Rathayibacter toxicus]KKM45804.1 N-acetyl-gamma-glutamyl-phosphate reductase [Rathayibacter toxicus]PPG22331.1 N-acetyl-gamma-glutamyl-phosphate reductase [Rathayibacter toxicus]PPG47167.1 N-acetyl-gamma-glutamyl-phosphate reductase [Rathayibacter toxicus]